MSPALADLITGDLDFLFGAEHGLFKGQVKPVLKIGTPARLAARPPGGTTEAAKPEQIPKDIGEVGKVNVKVRRSSSPHARMSKAVISRALLRVGEHCVRLVYLLKFFLCIWRLINIRMILTSQPPEGGFQLISRGIAGNT